MIWGHFRGPKFGFSGPSYIPFDAITLRVEIFAGIYFRESKKNAFRGYLFWRIKIDFLLISLFYADFDGISEKSTFRGYLISRNQQKFAKLAKISTREN